jgi:hypothetical protein
MSNGGDWWRPRSPTSDLVENVLAIVSRAVSKFLFLLYVRVPIIDPS